MTLRQRQRLSIGLMCIMSDVLMRTQMQVEKRWRGPHVLVTCHVH